jgi:hypothetical protein
VVKGTNMVLALAFFEFFDDCFDFVCMKVLDRIDYVTIIIFDVVESFLSKVLNLPTKQGHKSVFSDFGNSSTGSQFQIPIKLEACSRVMPRNDQTLNCPNGLYATTLHVRMVTRTTLPDWLVVVVK